MKYISQIMHNKKGYNIKKMRTFQSIHASKISKEVIVEWDDEIELWIPSFLSPILSILLEHKGIHHTNNTEGRKKRTMPTS